MKFLLVSICSIAPLFGAPLTALYSTLDPTSVAEHFAFFELYPDTQEGREALAHAWNLLSGGCADCNLEMILPSIDPKPVIALVNRSHGNETPSLGLEQKKVIAKLASHLANRSLAGSKVTDLPSLLALPPDQIDLARGLLIAEMGSTPDALEKIENYEASLDLMALQILARLPIDATPPQKIRAINDYLFSEMRFRFPPHSLYAKEIDVYTFLPSVLDSRRGVCLGVSILYLSLAQRLSLPLEAITPPGHIYVRYKSPEGNIINIETTARGIDVPSEHYLGIETRSLQVRTIREVIGLAFMNQAAVSWHRSDPNVAIDLYQKAQPFIEDEYLLNLFLGLNYLFAGQEKEGKELLEKVRGVIPEHAIVSESVSEDFLDNLASVEAIQAVFSEVDETRGSILAKQKKLEEITTQYPRFRQGIFHLAVTHLQLGREKEALPILQKYTALSPKDPTAHYYLSAIFFQRKDYQQSWKHLLQAEEILASKNHFPKALKELKDALERASPSPQAGRLRPTYTEPDS